MRRMTRLFIAIGAVFGLTAVAAGAFGAHALADAVQPDRLDVWRTAAQYQLLHGIALIVVALLGHHLGRRLITLAGGLFVAGVVIFSGSLYALVLTDTSALGAITPIGGVCMMAGWACVVFAAAMKGV